MIWSRPLDLVPAGAHQPTPPLLATAWLTSLLLTGATSLASQAAPKTAQKAELTIDRLFSGEFRTEGFGPSWWLEDSGLATLENAEGGGRDLVRFDPTTGKRTVVVAATQLVPTGREQPLTIEGYQFSTDGSKVLISTNTRRVWRRNTRGDYWVLDRESGRLEQIGAEFEPTFLQFAKFDPAATRVAYLYRNDIYVEDLADHAITRLTTTGSDKLSNGTFDWVYEEEWGLRDGFRWSPDGKRIAFWEIDAAAVGVFRLIDNTSGLYSKVTRIPYPKVGTTNARCRIGVVSTGAEPTIRWMKLPGDPSNTYVARMEWADRSDELILQHFNRLQNQNDVTYANADTGETRVVFTDRGDAWVEECDDLRWFDNGARFSFVSERDGWRHLYVISRDGKDVRLVTKGDYDVIRIEHIDDEGGFVYFLAAPDNPTQKLLYRTKLDGTGKLERLTPLPMGTHTYQIAPNGRHALHTWSSFGTPPKAELVELPSHRSLRLLATNQALRERLAATDLGSSEFFRVDTGNGIEMDGWVIRPPDFDASKRYPVIVFVYGEPAAQTALDRWGGFNYLWHNLLAQRGYVVLNMDNRGTPAPRGTAWRKSIYGKIGILAAIDQANGLRALQAKWPWLDRDRVGIWGWSGGGSMTLNAMFRYPDLYHTGIAIAFIANQRYYDTIYQERYMGLPSTNEQGFVQGSPITHAHKLKGNLLLVYGTGDDNCHYQNCEALVNELVRHNKQFDMQIYPNRSHSIYEGENTRRHLYQTMTNYLLEHVPSGAR